MVRKCRTCLHIEGDDLGLKGGLSLTLEKSDVYEQQGILAVWTLRDSESISV
uniref:hypothetical protein n=1 Tax=Prevotella sp. TaxID=59823 RepID=UPI0040263ADC